MKIFLPVVMLSPIKLAKIVSFQFTAPIAYPTQPPTPAMMVKVLKAFPCSSAMQTSSKYARDGV